MTTPIEATLDWRALAPEPEWHECDCAYCDMGGDLEPVQWPMLIRFLVGDSEYVSDRYIAIRGDLAPVPEGYEGVVQDASGPAAFPLAASTSQPATGIHFRWQIVKAVEVMGWRLRTLAHPDDAPEHTTRIYGVTTAAGELIGVAVAAKRIDLESGSSTFTPAYTEAGQ